ncbi:MAG: hypothetical protein EOP62_03120 [Sphingomonadales bacterium]|nr:MAG: hypothetical protein EOP62_03120 [Sphingomonadales bacterium]
MPELITCFTLAEIKQASILDQSVNLSENSTLPAGLFYWTVGNFTGQGDDLNIIEADSTALSVGAWVRQSAASIRTTEGDAQTALLNRLRVMSVMAQGAAGDTVPFEGLTDGQDDSDAFEASINKLRDEYTRLINDGNDQDALTKLAFCGPPLNGERGRIYAIGRDMPPLPPGCSVLMSGCCIVPLADNIRILWTDGGSQIFPTPGGLGGGNGGSLPDGFMETYGSDFGRWELPTFFANDKSGTLVEVRTVSHTDIQGGIFYGFRGGYSLTGASVANNSRFIGLTPAQYTKVKEGDVLDVGLKTPEGNVWAFMVVDKKVINAGAMDATYGKLKLDKPVVKATGTYTVTQMSFPIVFRGYQQSAVHGLKVIDCDYSSYVGRGREEAVTAWTDEVPTGVYNPCTDLRFYDRFEQGCLAGAWIGPSNSMIWDYSPSVQYNTAGSHIVVESISYYAVEFRIEIGAGSGRINSIPCIEVLEGSSMQVKGLTWSTNSTGRFLTGQGLHANVVIDGWQQASYGDIPLMPDGSYAPFVKRDVTGFLTVGSAGSIAGPGNYIDDPRRWATNGTTGATPGVGYAGYQDRSSNRTFYSTSGSLNASHAYSSEIAFAVRYGAEAYPRVAVQGSAVFFGSGASAPAANWSWGGTFLSASHGITAPIVAASGGYYVGANQVVGPQGAAVVNATDAAEANHPAKSRPCPPASARADRDLGGKSPGTAVCPGRIGDAEGVLSLNCRQAASHPIADVA